MSKLDMLCLVLFAAFYGLCAADGAAMSKDTRALILFAAVAAVAGACAVLVVVRV